MNKIFSVLNDVGAISWNTCIARTKNNQIFGQ